MDITRIAVERSISIMWEKYDQPLSLDELADAAFLSKFYFSRVFRAMTGTSPGRFLSAIRLYKAKQLLLETRMSVTEIAYHVGYNSLGTFASRFARSVGMAPGRYRSLSSTGQLSLLDLAPPGPVGESGTVTGAVRFPETADPVRVYVGAFANPLVEGVPVACDLLDSPGRYTLRGVPPGEWFVLATVLGTHDVDPRPWARRPRLLGAGGQVVVRPGRVSATQDIALRAATPLDLPILLVLPELDNQEVVAELERAG